MLTVATVNVNGVRAAVRRGMRPWLAERAPDVLCLQEVRGADGDLAAAATRLEALAADGRHVLLDQGGDRPGARLCERWSDHAPVVVRYDVGDEPAGGTVGDGLSGR